MAKRGGTSEVNGFISLGSDDKTTVKRKEDHVQKPRSDGAGQKKRDPGTSSSKLSTQNRSRLIEETSQKRPSKAVEVKDIKTNTVKGKIESTSLRKTESRHSTRKEPSTTSSKSRATVVSNEKPVISSPYNHKSRSEGVRKPSESASSPYISNKTVKPKTVQSSLQLKKQSSLHSKDSPYKSSLAQKNEPHTSSKASGDRLRNPSQLSGTPSKPKLSTSSKTASKPSKSRLASESSRHSKNPSPSSSSKMTTRTSKRSKKPVADILEEPESEQEVKPFGEIARSNTFTKEAPDSLMSDLSVSQSQEFESFSSVDQVDAEEYNYDDDFEDYESDFEEYVESDNSSSNSEEASSETETLDEDEIADVFKAGPSSAPQPKITEPEKKQTKSILKKKEENLVTDETNKETQNEKEKPLTVEEERKLDSGSYDLTSHADLRRKKQIQDIRTAMDKENANISLQSIHRKTRSFTEDEGFEEVFSHDSSTFIDTTLSPTEGLINFANARKQHMKQKAEAKVKKRGALLMEMIRLDVMSYNLLDIPSVPYEVYMQCYGRSNTFQIHTQTNEDAISEEVQTEEITTTTKWTQHPVKYSSSKSPDDLLFLFSQEKLGVGGESTVNEDEDWKPKFYVNSLRLHNFINNAGEMILTLLEEHVQDRLFELSNTTKRDFGFSESFMSLNVKNVDFLADRGVSIVCFSESNSSHILTVHKPSTKPLTIQAESEGRCVLCTWSVREPSSPLHLLVSSNNVASVCFHSHLVFAGLIDGVVCMWDLREQTATHGRSHLKQPTWLLRSPTYISADLEKDKRHFSSVVSIRVLPESNPDDSAKATSDQTPTQVVSLDEDGLLIVWTIVETKSTANIGPGLAPWGKVRLVQSSQLRTQKVFPKPIERMVQCRALCVDQVKPSNLYLSTNCGQVIHCLQTSTRARPQFYSADIESNSTITCMDFSRCGYPLLMVGDTAGRVQLYRTATERPLLDIAASATTPSPPITALQWSPSQPGLFFVLDANSSVHVWDLCSSDMCPQMSVPFSPQVVNSICLTPHPLSRMLAVASEAGTVDIYNLKAEFCALSKTESEEQHKIFSRYITIL